MIIHTPVMLKEVCEYLPQNPTLIVDCTLGHGGHAMALLSIAKDAKLIGFDVDEKMMDKAKQIIENGKLKIKSSTLKDTPAELDYSPSFQTKEEHHIEFVHGNYADIVSVLDGRKAEYILNDLGVNLEHFKDMSRGFSIRGDVPLDMRFDTLKGATAADILANYSMGQLQSIFEDYADFSSPKALELAKHIVSTRKQKPIETTQEFKKILSDCGLGDPASVVIFQALRIETNKELDNLKKFLADFPKCLQLSGRCVIITYHSSEDRLVKEAFKALADSGKYRLVTKKPLKPHYTEVAANRAARSAKMRILEKINE